MSGKRLKVLHIIESLRMGGAEMLLLNSIRDLDNYSHILVVLSGPEDLKNLVTPDTKYYRLNFKGFQNFFNTYLKLKKIVLREQPDIIHAHLFWAIILGRLVRKKTKFFFSLHGLIGQRTFRTNLMYRLLEKFTISSSQHMIAVSETVRNDYMKYIPFKGKISVIYNYIPDSFFVSKKSNYTIGDTLKIVTVGSLKTIKDHSTLIRAAALIQDKYVLDIFGYGETENELKTLISKLKTNVFLKGAVDDIHALLPHYDLFIMSSLSEGHSIALLEAMALGMPLILSDIPSFRETTDNKAIFFKVGDENDLRSKIEMMRSDIVLRQKVAESCHAVANKFAKRDKYLERIKEIYEG